MGWIIKVLKDEDDEFDMPMISFLSDTQKLPFSIRFPVCTRHRPRLASYSHMIVIEIYISLYTDM